MRFVLPAGLQKGLTLTTLLLISASGLAAPASARAVENAPALMIIDEPLPQNLKSQLYRKPFRAPDVQPAEISGESYFQKTDTVVGRKLGELRGELFALQGRVSELSQSLAELETNGQQHAATYYASIATINTQLQVGTTPGNPRLVDRLKKAQGSLEMLSGNITRLNDLATEISGTASLAGYMLETARSTYALSGAVEEDHVQLAQLEDAINNTVVMIDRLLNNINDDITRTTAYLGSERSNLRTISMAVRTGDLMGKSLSNRPFSGVQQASFSPQEAETDYMMDAPSAGVQPAAVAPQSGLTAPRPLVKIRFDRPDVSYEQPVYMAVNEALKRYPYARFELVAVHPSEGNAAKQAIEGTRARRNAERVLRTLTEMGMDLDRIDLSYAPSPQASTSEVHLYIR